jgi:hypothetical protein
MRRPENDEAKGDMTMFGNIYYLERHMQEEVRRWQDEVANEQRARLVKQAERPDPARRVLRFGRLTLAWGS